jgi:hypothetical protein
MSTTKQTPREVSFDCTRREHALVERIVHRANLEGLHLHRSHDKSTQLAMDLEATHANGCPLDFAKLARFDAFNFAHDVVGIQRHLDRDTGELRDCFVPRCAKPA